jgi:hypothetical protein
MVRHTFFRIQHLSTATTATEYSIYPYLLDFGKNKQMIKRVTLRSCDRQTQSSFSAIRTDIRFWLYHEGNYYRINEVFVYFWVLHMLVIIK